MKDILILGGGFAGVAAGLELKKHLPKTEARITLIDRQKAHLFTPSLYEVATKEQPQKNISIPFATIFGSSVEVIVANIAKIDTQDSCVVLADQREVHFDYLIICLGSQTVYFGIEGLEQHSLPLKTLSQAVSIKEKIEKLYSEKIEQEQNLKIFIGGGGFSGTELAAEMANYRDYLAKKAKQPSLTVEISVIEGSERLLNGLDLQVSALAKDRLEKSGIKIYLSSLIEKVTQDKIFIKDETVLDYDVLIWTGGVGANALLRESNLPLEKRGDLLVDSFLRVANFENIFAAGDNAYWFDPQTNRAAPWVAQIAEEQGKIAGGNVARAILGKPLVEYKLRHFGYVVPLRGKYAAAELEIFHFHGILGWILQQIIFLRYLLGILPLVKAFKRWNQFEVEAL